MTQESDSIKTDISPQAAKLVGGASAAGDVRSEAPSPDVSKMTNFQNKALRILTLCARKLFDYSGEIFAVSCGLAMFWLYAMSLLLTQQSVDITRFRPDAERWFSDAFDGNNAQLGSMSLRWLPATDAVVLDLQNVTVNGADGELIQDYKTINIAVPLSRVIAAQPTPTHVKIRGGSLTWLEDENGGLVAGLGRPDTVGRLGPVFRGKLQATGVEGAYNRDNLRFMFAGFTALEIQNTELYYSSEINNLDVVINLDNLSLVQDNAELNLNISGNIQQDGSLAPIDIKLATDTNFSRFEGSLRTRNARLDLIAPRQGRYEIFSGLAAPIDLDVNSIFSQEDGLQSSRVELEIGTGSLALKEANYAFKSALIIADLEPGQQRMEIKKVALVSDRLRFSGAGELSQLGALNDGDINSSPVFDVSLVNVTIDATPVFEAPLNFTSAQASGQIDFDARSLSLSKLSLNIDPTSDRDLQAAEFENRFGINLSVDARQNPETGQLEMLKASGFMNGTISPQDLLKIWPPKAADGARRWVDNSLKSAVIQGFKFQTNLDADYFANPSFSEEYINAELDIRDGRVKYMRDMPALENVVAKGRLIGNRIEADIKSATVGGLNIETGSVTIPRIFPIGGDIIIDMTGTGQASDMLSLIDNEPFKFATNYGVDPVQFGGQGKIDMRITRPMLVYFDQNRIEYSVKGNFTNASTPFEILGQKLTEGDIYLEADKTGMSMTGPVTIGPWPVKLEWQEFFGEDPPPTRYNIEGSLDHDMLDKLGVGAREFFDGVVNLEIEAMGRGLDVTTASLAADLTQAEFSVLNVWAKPVGQDGQLFAELERGASGSIRLPSLMLTAPGLEVLGELEIEQNLQLKLLDISKMRIDGLINAAVQLKPDAQNSRLSLFVKGEYLDVSPWTNSLLGRRNDSSIDVPLIMTATIDELTLKDNYILSDAKFLFTHTGNVLSNLRLGGVTNDGDFTAELVTNSDDDTRLVSIEIPDASKAAAAFLGLNSTEGGNLDIKAKLAPIDSDGMIVGNAEMSDFKLKRAPFMAQILSLASLTGLVDTLGGDGLSFDRFELPFTFSDDLFQVRGARLYGPALGMTGDGDIQIDTRVLDIDGTVVPAYNANTIFSDIPVLGSLIGKKGEGVFALNYDVSGPFEKVKISVNPLSALTPGFLRGIFQPQREKLPEEVLEQIQAVRPRPESDKAKGK